MDDSTSVQTRGECRKWLESFGRGRGLAIYYAGLEEKSSFIRRMSLEGVPPASASFLLTNSLDIPGCPGANRNALLLHAVGDNFLSCDDDSVCRGLDLTQGAQHPHPVPLLSTAERIHYCSEESSLLEVPRRLSQDLLSAHEELLGQPLRSLLLPVRNSASVAVSRIGARFAAHLLEGAGRVVVTASGVMGDSGVPHPATFMLSSGSARARFLANWAEHRDWNGSRRAVIGSNKPTIAAQGPLAATTATGFCNRVPLLPFTPSGRGEDTLFGILLRECFPDAYTGHIPIALLHAPRDPRRYAPLPNAPNLVDLLHLLLRDCAAPQSPDPVRTMGVRLVDFATARADTFKNHLRCYARRWVIGFIEAAERLLDVYHGQPAFWAVEMRNWIARLELTLAHPELGLPADMTTCHPPEEQWLRMQVFLEHYGEVLRDWNEIVGVALRLRSSDCRIGIRIA